MVEGSFVYVLCVSVCACVRVCVYRTCCEVCFRWPHQSVNPHKYPFMTDSNTHTHLHTPTHKGKIAIYAHLILIPMALATP